MHLKLMIMTSTTIISGCLLDAQPEHRGLFPRDMAGVFPRPTILVIEWLSHREAGGRVWVVPSKAPTRSTLLPVLLTKRCLMQSNTLWLMRFTWLVCSVPITVWFPKKTLKFSLWKRKNGNLMNPT